MSKRLQASLSRPSIPLFERLKDHSLCKLTQSRLAQPAGKFAFILCTVTLMAVLPVCSPDITHHPSCIRLFDLDYLQPQALLPHSYAEVAPPMLI